MKVIFYSLCYGFVVFTLVQDKRLKLRKIRYLFLTFHFDFNVNPLFETSLIYLLTRQAFFQQIYHSEQAQVIHYLDLPLN